MLMTVLKDWELLWLSEKFEQVVMNGYWAFSVEQVCLLIDFAINEKVQSASLKVLYDIIRTDFIKINIAL